MSDKIIQSPQIRFVGFTNAWEQRQLNEYLTTSKVKNRDERFGKEDVLSVSGEFGIVNQIEFQGRSFAGVSVATYGVVEKGDVVYTKSPLKSNPFGIIKSNNGQAGIVSTLYAVYKPNDNVDSNFVERYFESHQRLNRYLQPLVNKGAKNDMKVSDDNALSGTVVYPVEVDEQRKISSFFNQLDNLITLHQRELELLKDTKKILLQKMFPKDGADVPEIRFAGFTDVWEQRKLGELLEKRSSPVELEKDLMYKQIGIRSHGKGIFYKESVTGESIGNKRVFWIEPNSLILNIVFAWEQAVARTTEKEVGMIASHRFPMYKMKREILDLDFIVHFFLTQKGKQLLESASPGGAGRNKTLGQKKFESLLFIMPSYDEQHKISKFIDATDNRIASHQRELNLLKDLKKSMLQQMFI